MIDINRITLLGRLGGDPVQKTTQNGKIVVNFSVATARRFQATDASEPQEETQWHKIVVWGKRAESCSKYLKKGNPVLIEGRLQSRDYEGVDGVKRKTFEINADTINFLNTQNQNRTKEDNSLLAS